MAVTIPNTFTNGYPAIASEVNGNFAAVKAFVDGIQTGTNIDTGAIVDSKLAVISTAGKVANSATTATSNNVADKIVTRDPSGNFSAGAITATSVSAPNLPRGVVSYARTTGGGGSLNSYIGGSISFGESSTSFLPVAGRLYRITYSIGQFSQPNSPGLIIFTLINSLSATVAKSRVFENTTNAISHSYSVIVTSSQLGTSATLLSLQATTNESVTVTCSNDYPTMIVVEDIGLA